MNLSATDLVVVTDVIFIAFDNIKKYSGSSSPEIGIKLGTDADTNLLNLEVTNNVAQQSLVAASERRMAQIRQRIDARAGAIAARREGGSGFLKIAAAVQDAEKGALEFGFMDKNKFRLFVSLPLDSERRPDAGRGTYMKILLVEDEDPKQKHLEAYLRESVSGLDLRIAKSYNSAINSLEEGLPDLLLLDMSLPTFDRKEKESGGRPQGFGGVEILRFLTLSEMSCPIVVITGYDAFPKGTGQVVISQLRAELTKESSSLPGNSSLQFCF